MALVQSDTLSAELEISVPAQISADNIQWVGITKIGLATRAKTLDTYRLSL